MVVGGVGVLRVTVAPLGFCGLFFHSGDLAWLAPLPLPVQFAQREFFAALPAFALNLRDPGIPAGAESSHVCWDNESGGKFDGAFAAFVFEDGVGFHEVMRSALCIIATIRG